MATKHKSRILQEVHEMASDLYEIGLIDKRCMREFDALYGIEIHEMPPSKIKQLREKAPRQLGGIRRGAEHQRLTVQKWEIGAKKPRASLKLLNLIEQKGLEAVLFARA